MSGRLGSYQWSRLDIEEQRHFSYDENWPNHKRHFHFGQEGSNSGSILLLLIEPFEILNFNEKRNVIGRKTSHTISLISEEYRMTNQKTDTIFSQVRKLVSVFPAFRGGHASNLYLCHWRENCRVALLCFFHNVSRLQQGLLMLALSKILFFNTRINQLFKKQKEMSSFYSHF